MKFRLAVTDDAPRICAMYEPIVRDTAISFEVEPPGAEEMARRLRDTRTRYPWLVCVRGEEVLGYAYASQHRARAGPRIPAKDLPPVTAGSQRDPAL